jgi:hypothetical protein
MDIEVDLRRGFLSVFDVMWAQGLPVIVLPLDQNRKPLKQGYACTTDKEFIAAIYQAYREAPSKVLRIVPVMRQNG